MTAESYNEKYAPLLGEWTIKRCIGSGSYGRVFEIERRDALGTVNTSALKIISLPQSEDDLRSTIETNNLTGDSVSSYYRSCADAITNEINLMSELKAQSNIVSYEDHKIVPHKDGIGWDILIRMELLTPLNVHLQRTVQMPRGEVVRMGIHLCRALELCQRHNIIHRDVKSENIFISADGNYKLGDFGVARTVLASSGALTQVGSPSYMAPEMFQAGKTYNASVDTYALGLVLYRCLNEGRLPFYPPYPQPLTPEDRNMAEGKRLSGLELPRAVNATAALDAILRKACAPDPAGRFASPTEMRLALEAVLRGASDAAPVPDAGDATVRAAAPAAQVPAADAAATVAAAPKAPETPDAADETTRLPFGQQPAAQPTAPAKAPAPKAEDETVFLFAQQEQQRREAEAAARKAEEEARRAEEQRKAEEARAAAAKEQAQRAEQERKAREAEEAARKAEQEKAEAAETPAPAGEKKISRRKMLGVIGGAAALALVGGAGYAVYSAESSKPVAEGSCGDGLTWSISGAGVLTIQGSGTITGTPWEKLEIGRAHV